ncbi:MAG: FAD-dependent oxidoreductase, partial [bacterium]|nr:FAD-dependent oxidoreductase [bacterium]
MGGSVLMIATLLLLISGSASPAEVVREVEGTESPQTADLVVLGGSPSGLAAAVQGARLGLSVIVVEPYQRIGGMMSAGLTRTDLGHAATTGGMATEFFKRVSAHYDPAKKPWSEQAMSFFFEPSVAEDIWWQMVHEAKHIRVIVPAQLVSVSKDGERLQSIRIKDLRTGSTRRLEAEVFVDATYEGDLAAMAGAPYRVGREAKEEFGEPHGLEQADDLVQAYCLRLCVTDDEDNLVAIAKPEGYNPDEFKLLAEYVEAKNIREFVPDCLFAREKVNGKADGNAQWHCWVSTDWAGINSEYPEGGYATRDGIYEEYCRLTLGWWY